MVLPAFRDALAATNASATVSFTIPITVQAGDLMLLTVQNGWAVTRAPGWCRLFPSDQIGSSFSATFYRYAQAGDAGASNSVTFASAYAATVLLTVYSGADLRIEVPLSGYSEVDGTSVAFPVPALTGDARVVRHGVARAGNTTDLTVSAGTQRAKIAGNDTGGIAVEDTANGGSVPTATLSEATAGADLHAITVLLKDPVSPAPPAATGRYVGHVAASLATSTVLVLPAGVQAGDLLLMQVTGDFVPTIPAGWTLLNSNDGSNINCRLAWRLAATGVSGGDTVTVTVGTAGGTAQIAAYRGVEIRTHAVLVDRAGALSAQLPSAAAVAGDTSVWMVSARGGPEPGLTWFAPRRGAVSNSNFDRSCVAYDWTEGAAQDHRPTLRSSHASTTEFWYATKVVLRAKPVGSDTASSPEAVVVDGTDRAVDTSATTTETNEPVQGGTGGTIWLEPTSVAGELITITTTGSDFTPQIAVYRGSINTAQAGWGLMLIAHDPNPAGSSTATVVWVAQAGDRVQVGGKNGSKGNGSVKAEKGAAGRFIGWGVSL